ncbi:MAG TPA: hypothetical protein DD417_17860 [Elusimicrobia bacterium]|nr:hypothetical protein [Elusimicrobiota bacterium]
MWSTGILYSISILPLLLGSGLAFGQVVPAPEPVVIGVLDPAGASLTAGAEAAVRDANADGGVRGHAVVLRPIAAADPWKDGAAAVARFLASEPRVLALLAPADGAASHVVVQAATRLRVPILTASPERSLTQAKDPWVFRVVPDDEAQAEALLRWVFPEPKGRSAELVVPDGREGRERLRSLREACRALGVREASSGEDADAVLLWLDPETALDWFAKKAANPPGLVLASTRLDDPAFLRRAPPAAAGAATPLLRAPRGSPAADWEEASGYDMAAAVLAAARSEGLAPAAVRRGLARGGPWEGRSGSLAFDERGNRRGTPAVGVLEPGPAAAFVRKTP